MGKRKTAPTPAAAPAPEQRRNRRPAAVRVDVPVVNIRQEPSNTAPITGKVRRGDILSLSEKEAGWGKLTNGLGWVNLALTAKI